MNKKRLVFLVLSFVFPFSLMAQFNTIVKEKTIEEIKPSLKTTDNTVTAEEKEIQINDGLSLERKNYWNKRRYLSLPIDTLIITSPFGRRTDPITGKKAYHKGIDLRGNNDYVYSVMPGIVTKAGKNKGLGNYVEIKHGDFTSLYAHLYNVLVNAKQTVEAGQPIGISGSTGKSTGEHLHFQLEHLDKVIDPKPFLEYVEDIIRIVKGEVAKQIEAELSSKVQK